MSVDAMKQALEALNTGNNEVLPEDYGQMVSEAITALRAAIEQAEKQEPVAWMFVNTDGECEQIEYIKNEPMPDDPSITPLYTAPRQWQGLTDEEIYDCLQERNREKPSKLVRMIAKAIEEKLKEKNG